MLNLKFPQDSLKWYIALSVVLFMAESHSKRASFGQKSKGRFLDEPLGISALFNPSRICLKLVVNNQVQIITFAICIGI
jgi:hypothetical protein